MTETLKELGSSIAKLRILLSESKKDVQRIQTLENNLALILDGLWTSVAIRHLTTSPSLWKEFVALVASGRILSSAAEAEQALSTVNPLRKRSWISDGHQYAEWIGGGVVSLAQRLNSTEDTVKCKAVSLLLSRSFSLGYTDTIVARIVSVIPQQDDGQHIWFRCLLANLDRFAQRQILISTCNWLSKQIPVSDPSHVRSASADRSIVGAAAALLRFICSEQNSHLETELVAWLSRKPLVSVGLYRACVMCLSPAHVQQVMETSWQLFSDKLSIEHTPILQQEALARILLIAAGHINRLNPSAVRLAARGGAHASGISTRLGSSSTTTRFLGLVVGTAISRLVDKPESRMNFHVPEMESPEAEWYISLTHIQDIVGSIQDLQRPATTVTPVRNNLPSAAHPVRATKMQGKALTKIEVIDSEEDDNDLIPYSKIDSDPEDEEDDPLTAKRDRPAAPVYIRDLVTGLQDTENYQQHNIALDTAAGLIRRKAEFGNELSDRCEELGGVLVSLHDTFKIANFHDLQLQAMIALLVAQPKRMGPFYATTFFSGDFSIAQRATVLTAIGLGARELAGFATAIPEKHEMPTGRLPERLHTLYADNCEIDVLAKQLENSRLQPTSKQKRPKTVRNDLGKIVAESFFLPLTGRWQAIARTSEALHTYHSPFLLPLYIKTLAIVLSAAGPFTLALAAMTLEFWDLLLSIRAMAMRDAGGAIVEAVLFGLLTLLDMNEDKRGVAQDYARHLLETHEWVQTIFEQDTGGDAQSDRVKNLAARVLILTAEIVEKHQRLMMGDLLAY